jgi:hypothetical protein
MTAPPAGGQYDFSYLYADYQPPCLADVNGMSLPDALIWYSRNGFNVHVGTVTPDGTRRLARQGGYHFDTLPPPSAEEVAWLAANWRPGWFLAMILGEGTGLWAIDADSAAQWEKFQAEYGDAIARTAIQRTGSGLFHLVYQRPEDAGPGGLILRQGAWSEDYPRIEVKSKAMITVAPSAHHETGQPYQWLPKGAWTPKEPDMELLAGRARLVFGSMTDRRAAELRIDREARRMVDAEEQALARGSRLDLSWEQLTALPKPVWIYQRLLTQGWHGLAGPPEAGKSLLARNWLCEIAAAGRNVVYVLSEGQFDLEDRFRAHPLTGAAHERLWFLDGGPNLASASDVTWFCETYAGRKPALVVFDMIYGSGLPDDNGVQGVAPVIAGGKTIASALGCAVLAVGHPGLNGERRFRGSSMWRGSFDTEWHMADGQLSCEKHKYADRRAMQWPYQVEWPDLRLLGAGEVLNRVAARMSVIAEDFAMFPEDSDASRARRIAGRLGCGQDRARVLVRDWRRNQ